MNYSSLDYRQMLNLTLVGSKILLIPFSNHQKQISVFGIFEIYTGEIFCKFSVGCMQY